MKLMTEEIRKKLPPLYSQDGKGYDAVAVAKFFTPDSSWTWFATEGSPVDSDGIMEGDEAFKAPAVDFLFFGLVDGHDRELGYFSLNELEQATGPMGLHIERDRFWKPKPLTEV